MRKLIKFLIVAGLVLGLAFYAAGGWYFSEVFRSDALENTQTAPIPDIEVAGFNGSAITLRQRPNGDDQLFDPGVYGLEWDGGYGQVGPIVAGEGSVVDREFAVLTGQPPSVGQLADVEATGFPPDPGALGRTWRVVSYESELGAMEAWHVDGSGSTWVVIVHGKGAAIDEGMRMLSALPTEEFPALMVSYRNDPGQPDDPSGYYRYGQTEWRDLKAAIGYAHDQGAGDVILVGLSTGAAIVLSYLEQVESVDDVRALIFDSPNVDFGATVDYNAAQRTLPGIGTRLPQSLTNVAKWLASWRFGVDWPAINYLGREIRAIPTLIFHGTDDLTVPIETSRRLAAAMGSAALLVEVDGASHVGSWNADPRAYVGYVVGFLDSLDR